METSLYRLVADTRDYRRMSDVIGRDTKLTPVGREFVGLCVFHDEQTPSLRVSDVKGEYRCLGCGASGDALKYVMERQRMGFMEALAWLGAADLPIIQPHERAQYAAEAAEHVSCNVSETVIE